MKTKKIFWLLLAPILLVSCWNASDYDDFGIEPMSQSWALPVLNSTITFKDVVERSGSNAVVEENPSTGVFFMAFRDTLDFANATDQFQLEGANFPLTFNVPLPSAFTGGFQQDITQTYPIVTGAEIKQIDLLSGKMILEIQNNYQHRVKGVLTITSLEANGVSFKKSFDLNGSSTNTSENLLNDYMLLLYDAIGNTYNTLMVNVSLQVFQKPLTPDNTGSLSVNINFENPDFDLIYGMVNKNLSLTDQNYELSAFNSTIIADQHFAEPYFNFTVENSYGVPVGFTFTNFKVSNIDDVSYVIENQGIIGSGDINLSGVNVVDFLQNPSETVKKSKFELTKENSNIEDAFDNAPNKLSFGTNFTLGDTNHERFIKRDSKITFISDMVIPLYGWAKTHEIGDTIFDMEWPDIKNDFTFLKDDYKVTLKFKTTNELPLDIYLQLVTLVDNGGVITPDYSFFEEGKYLAKSAEVDASGVSTKPSIEYLTLTLTKVEYEQIVNSNHLVLKYRLVTGGNGNTDVKILSKDHIQVQMSMLVKGTVEL